VTAAAEARRARLIRVRRRILAPVHDVRVGLWATREVRRLRRVLADDGIRVAVRRPPSRMSRNAGRVVVLASRLARASCLERSLLRQAWLRARGTDRDVVIGVRSQGEFEAHAWLDGDPDGAEYAEIHRIRANSTQSDLRLPNRVNG
jgi:Transglutaminase-like superfamily